MAKFNIGDSVVVKKGVKDPDFDTDLGGWYGRIQDINPINKNVVEIGWDSITLRIMPPEMLALCIQESLDFASVTLLTDELEPAQPRDTIEETQEILTIINTQRALILSEEDNDDLAVDFFAPIAAHLAGNNFDWDDEDEYEEEIVFNIEEFFTLLEIPKGEEELVERCLATGLYNYYLDIYGYEKYGNDLAWLVEDRMYEPFIFGYGTIEILKNKKISAETKQKIIAYTLSTTNPAEEHGIPYGLIHILQYLAKNELLDLGTFNLIMITLQANPHSGYDGLPPAGWIDLSKWIINSPEISTEETIWWIWQFSTKFERSLSYAQGKKVVNYWMNHKGLSSESKGELCWAWLTDSKDVGRKPIAWQLMDAQMTGDVNTVKQLLKKLGVPPAEIADAIRTMEQSQAELNDQLFGLSMFSGLSDFVWLPGWLKRTAVPQLIQSGEDPLELCDLLLDQSRDYNSEAINKGVADILSQYGSQLPPDELRALVEKGLNIPQVQTRKTFYQLSTQFYGDEYMLKTQSDNAVSIRKWGKKKLND